MQITKPVPYQVIQRSGFAPSRAHADNPGRPELGWAEVDVEVVGSGDSGEIRVQAAVNGDEIVGWSPPSSTGLRLPAGGWYRVEARCGVDEAALAPVGVGEVFVIAGQSYAANHNDAQLRVDEPSDGSPCLITAYAHASKSWQVAHDPQPQVRPHSDMEHFGTPWPAAMNLLQPLLRVPVGMVNVAVGGSVSRQWMPGEELFENLVRACRAVGRFRYILWQQGESDVIEGTAASEYKRRLRAIRTALDRETGRPTTWVLAKSTLHPTVYSDPAGEGRIRGAIDDLCRRDGFLSGPDTDILGTIGLHRADMDGSRHFTRLGQERAGLLWFASLWHHLGERNAPHERSE